MLHEWNFDGLVGPTHNYAGLSAGNIASLSHGGQVSNPRAAALQGLAKMRFVRELGVRQGVLPPQPRPSLRMLRRLGFSGSDEEILASAASSDHQLLRLCSSASAMWTANAATLAPASDTLDSRLHLVPANLQTMFHRSLEAEATTRVLRLIFQDESRFVVHDPLPASAVFADEGAANHTRLETSEGAVHLLAWGRRALRADPDAPQRYPARQTLEASESLARLLRIPAARTLLPRQHPAGIDAGAFHTDVLAVGTGPFLMLHELAFADPTALVESLRRLLGDSLVVEVATQKELPVEEAIASYPFNSQVLRLPGGDTCIVAPTDARENRFAHAFLQRLEDSGSVSKVHYIDVRESMDNGGGPACLRLRVPLSDADSEKLGGRVEFTPALESELEAWIRRHYRDRLSGEELGDPALWREQMTALDELTRLLGLEGLYDFQH